MSHEIATTIVNRFIGLHRAKRTASNWFSFNAVCCLHNGASSADKRGRGGLRYSDDGGFGYHCFNCGFKTRWHPGNRITYSMHRLLDWAGFPEDEIKKLEFDAWMVRDTAIRDGIIDDYQPVKLEFKNVSLPDGAMPFSHWLAEDCSDQNFVDVISYVYDRGDTIYDGWQYFWTPKAGKYDLNRRVIIPFYWEDELVGWTSRSIEKISSRRYFSDIQPDYIFNTDRIKRSDERIFIVEGPFDAISINACATLGDKVSPNQIKWFNQQPQEKIIVPDMTMKGGQLVNIALENNWSVSLPDTEWRANIKDVAQLVQEYGKLYAMKLIIDNTTSSKLKINTWRQIVARNKG